MLNFIYAQPLRRLLSLGFGAIILMIGFFGWITYRDADVLADLTEQLYRHPFTVAVTVRDIEVDTIKIHRAMKDVALARDEAGIAAALAAVDMAEKDALAKFPLLKERFLGDKTLVDKAQQALIDWRPIRAQVAAAKRAGNEAEAARLNQTVAAEAVKAVTSPLDSIQTYADEKAEAFHKMADQEREEVIGEIIRDLGLIILVSLGVGFLISAAVRNPIAKLRDCMDTLAHNDLSIAVPFAQSQNEIGAMARAVQVFKDNGLERERLKSEAEREQEARARRQLALEAAIAGFEKSASAVVATVASASTELQASAQSMAQAAEETSLQSTTVASAAHQASTNVQSVAAAGEELSASIAEIGRRAKQSSDLAQGAVRSAEATDVQVQELAAAAEKIGAVVGLINGIAAQTNLLALNATIEAARAGDAGKGFAVVAAEVKELANQTTRATGEIGETVASIQTVTGQSIEAIQAIGRAISELDGIARTITASMEEQARATAEISDNVQQAARGTEEVSASIGHVSEAANSTGTASAQVLGAAGDLAQQSERLREELDRFLTAVRAA